CAPRQTRAAAKRVPKVQTASVKAPTTQAPDGGAPKMIPESSSFGRDYPQMAAERGRIEPAPRRVRGYFDNTLIFDTTRARYVWETPYYPQYYIPLSEVRMEVLLDENHPQRL